MTASHPDRLPRPSRPGRPPSRRRRAHQASANLKPERVRLDHPLVPRQGPQWIDQPDALAEALEHVRQAGCCAYDTEFIGEETYRPRLCLVQLATCEQIFIIDALAGLSLEPLWQVLGLDSLTKVVHAGEQDIEPLARHLGRVPGGLFDTQVAAAFAGLRYPVSLSRLVESVLGVRLPKGLTFTQWDERPMSPSHLHYAADDVRFGLALQAELVGRLERLGNRQFAEQAIAERYALQRYTFDVEAVAQRIRGARGLDGRKPAVLRQLICWRDRAARQVDLPPRTFCKDEILVNLARRPVQSLDRLEQLPFLSNYHKRHHGPDILAAIRRGLEQPPARPTGRKVPEPTAEQLFHIDRFWVAVMAYCYERGVDPAVVTNRAQVAKLYLHAGSSPRPANPDLGPLGQGWRGQFIGTWLSEYLAGRASVELSNRTLVD